MYSRGPSYLREPREGRGVRCGDATLGDADEVGEWKPSVSNLSWTRVAKPATRSCGENISHSGC